MICTQVSVSDFFDALVAMKFLDREGDSPSATYFNKVVLLKHTEAPHIQDALLFEWEALT